MNDVVYALLVAALFLVAFGFARLCWLLMTD